MRRGDKVKVTGEEFRVGKRQKVVKTPKHLVGRTGIVLERMTNSGYIRILSTYEGYYTDLCCPEETLTVVEEAPEV